MRMMYKGRVFAALAGALLLAAVPWSAGSASAATLAAPAAACQASAFRASDMAGVYLAPEHAMRVEVYECGGVFVQWDNDFGRHGAAYYGAKRVEGGGFVATKMAESVESLDATGSVGVKPAEKGYIQVITASPYGDLVGLYRLKKV